MPAACSASAAHAARQAAQAANEPGEGRPGCAGRGGAGARVPGLRGQVRAHPSEQGEHAGEDRLPEATGDTDAGKQSHLLLSRQVLHCPTPLSGWGSGGDRK